MSDRFSRLADAISTFVGSLPGITWTVGLFLLDLAWGIKAGAFTHPDWSNLNGAGTGFLGIFLLVFLQHSGNRSTAAILLHLSRQSMAEKGVPNAIVGSENLPEIEIKRLQDEALDQVKNATEEGVKEANGAT